MKRAVWWFALISIVASTAMAEQAQPLKDTRTYLEQDGQKILYGGVPVAVSGELLVKAGDWCERKTYSRNPDQKFTPPDMPNITIAAPNVAVKFECFRCDAEGNRAYIDSAKSPSDGAGRDPAPLTVRQHTEAAPRYAVLMEVRNDGGLIHRFGGIGSSAKPMVYGDAMGETGYQMTVQCKQLGQMELSCSMQAEFSKGLLGGAAPQFPAQAPVFNYKVEDLVLTEATTEYIFNKDGYEVKLQAKLFE